MKKIVFTGVLCLLAGFTFGQKKVVNAAKNEIKGNQPNITEARNLIKDALVHPETANEAETWYVAGSIEGKQFDVEQAKEITSKKADDEVMYSALERILPYFIKAAELDQRPDAKGNVKPKFLKDIRSTVRANRPYYINAALLAYEREDFKKAYENFKLFGDIPNLDIFKGEKWEIAEGDTTELQIRYYAGLAASFIPDHQAAIAMWNEVKSKPYTANLAYEESELLQRLANEYLQIDDSTAWENIIKEGFSKFPAEDYFLRSMVNINIASGKVNESISFLEKALALSPDNAQFHDVMGQLYEIDKNNDEAVKYMKKAIDMEPDNIEFLSHLGRVYFNIGVEKRAEADNTPDVNKSKEITTQSQDHFRLAMPLFEKIFKLDPKDSGAIYALRSIYYTLTMNAEYEKMDALFNEGN